MRYVTLRLPLRFGLPPHTHTRLIAVTFVTHCRLIDWFGHVAHGTCHGLRVWFTRGRWVTHVVPDYPGYSYTPVVTPRVKFGYGLPVGVRTPVTRARLRIVYTLLRLLRTLLRSWFVTRYATHAGVVTLVGFVALLRLVYIFITFVVTSLRCRLVGSYFRYSWLVAGYRGLRITLLRVPTHTARLDRSHPTRCVYGWLTLDTVCRAHTGHRLHLDYGWDYGYSWHTLHVVPGPLRLPLLRLAFGSQLDSTHYWFAFYRTHYAD